ncbi:Myosin ATPase [Forsythia ovata]|uniref:Myosin ATPase n=1 Tax=Forsythia ovata TaxID=205694 RepID=A0ABD1W205_9LAMI
METPVPVEDTEKVDALTAEVENLKELLQSEKQRADSSERKTAETLESSNKKSQKLEETERRVHQLQESLNRMIYSMSGQFSELKMILCASSNLSSTSGLIARDDQDDDTSTSSDTTSSDSDFTFPAPVSTPANLSSFNPGAFQLIVQDLSAAENSDVSPPPTSVPVDGPHKASSSDPLMSAFHIPSLRPLFHYGVFFAYMRLREQEIRNLMWISECVAQNQKSRVHDSFSTLPGKEVPGDILLAQYSFASLKNPIVRKELKTHKMTHIGKIPDTTIK